MNPLAFLLLLLLLLLLEAFANATEKDFGHVRTTLHGKESSYA
jgi:hypothetical protein